MNPKLSGRFTLPRSVMAVAAAVATAFGVASVPAVQAAELPALDAPYTWVEEFDSEDALNSWNIFRQPDYNNKDALYTRDALEVADGKLTITTQRHCVDEDIDLSVRANHDLLNESTVSVEPCGPEQFEKFTSGRLASPQIARGKFTASVTATIDTGDVEGVRSAIWMQNLDKACSNPENQGLYGELDLVEYFSYDDGIPGGGRSRWSPSNTHLGCNTDSSKGTNDAPRELKLDEPLSGNTYTWTVTTTEQGVEYYLDDEPIDRKSWAPNDSIGHATVEDFNLSNRQYREIMDQPWTLTLNQKVENADWARPRASDLDFPVRTMEVERIEVEGEPFPGPDLTDPNSPLTEYTLDWIDRTPELERYEEASEDFTYGERPEDWKFFDQFDWSNENVYHTPEATTFHDGVMDITTRRHCLASEDEGVSIENASVDPCGAGEIIRYSSSRVHLPQIPGGNFRLTVRAKSTAEERVDGVRTAIWMQNDDQFCGNTGAQGTYGELDLTELYSSRPTSQYSTVHLGCGADGQGQPAMSQRHMDVPGDLWGDWHEWGVEVFDGQVVFTLDGEPVSSTGTDVFGNRSNEDAPITGADVNLPEDQLRKVMEQPWGLILNAKVEHPERDTWIAPVDEEQDFPEHHFLIDYVAVDIEPESAGREWPDTGVEPSSSDTSSGSSSGVESSGRPWWQEALAGVGVLGAIAVIVSQVMPVNQWASFLPAEFRRALGI